MHVYLLIQSRINMIGWLQRMGILITGLLILLDGHSQEATLKANPDNFTFLVAGHAYGAPNVVNHPFHPPLMQYLETHVDSIDFLILTGDVVQEADKNSWDKVDHYLEKLGIQTIVVPGNHDLKDDSLFHSRYGKSNFSFEVGNNIFFLLDLLETGWNISPELMEWISDRCEQKRYENVFMFSHHLFWYDPEKTPGLYPNSMYRRSNQQTFYSSILAQFRKLKGKILVYGGDVGATVKSDALQLHRIENAYFHASGMGQGERDNVIMVHVENDIPQQTIIYLNDQATEEIGKQYTTVKD